MLKYVFIVATLATGPATAQTPPVLVGQNGVVAGDFAACRKMEDYDKLGTFSSASDEVAFRKFLSTKMLSGDCVVLSPGTAVHVDHSSFWGNYCVRPIGAVDCVWTYKMAVKKP